MKGDLEDQVGMKHSQLRRDYQQFYWDRRRAWMVQHVRQFQLVVLVVEDLDLAVIWFYVSDFDVELIRRVQKHDWLTLRN